ncbi:MAG TPA: hypothetical protein PKC28_14550 [Bdellovibrionales bacterium]|nr:hypothetical protein [Bdellovibrionales bacterium]
MGTVQIGFASEPLATTLKAKIRESKRSCPIMMNTDVYRNGIQAYVYGHKLAVCWNPRFPNRSIPYYRCQLHRSEFANIGEMWAWLRRISGQHFDELLRAKLMRVDCWVDVALPLSLVRESLHRKNGKNWNTYDKGGKNRKGETVEWGSPAHKTKAYERTAKRGQCDYFEVASSGNQDEQIPVVRIETELKGKKLKSLRLTSLSELESLKFIYPFDHMKILILGGHIREDAPQSVKIQWAAMKYEAARSNLTGALQLVNKNRNFIRTIEPWLVKPDVDFLKKAYQNHLQRFFSMGEAPKSTSIIASSEYRRMMSAQMQM